MFPVGPFPNYDRNYTSGHDDMRLQAIEQIWQFLEGNHETESEPVSGVDR